MHLATYRFTGDPAELIAGYRRLAATFPPGVIELNLAVELADGLLVIDACPTEADFEAFSSSAMWSEALAACGLPTPTVESMGTVVGATGSQLAATV